MVFAPLYSAGEPSIQAELAPSAQAKVSPRGLTNVGFAAFNLTAPNFNCSGFFRASQKLDTLHVALLYNTFGNDFACLKKLLADPRLQTLEVALINEPGHRNNRLGSYEFLSEVGTVLEWETKLRSRNSRLKDKFFRYTQPLRDVLTENVRPNTTVIINPGLESNLSPRAGRVLVAWTRQFFPSYRVVWNPLIPSPRLRSKTRADLIEGHNISPNIQAPCLYNMDGTDVSFPDRPAIGQRLYKEGQTKNWVQSGAPLFQLIEQFANRCEVAFVWTAESNGIDESKTSFVDPRKRNHKIPKHRYDKIFSQIEKVSKRGRVYPVDYAYSAKDKQVELTCSKVYSIFPDGEKAGNLLKQSEFSDRGAVLILSKGIGVANNVQLVKGNTVIDTFEPAGRYKDGRFLFRSPRSPTTYPLLVYLTFVQNGAKICYKIPNPRIRVD